MELKVAYIFFIISISCNVESESSKLQQNNPKEDDIASTSSDPSEEDGLDLENLSNDNSDVSDEETEDQFENEDVSAANISAQRHPSVERTGITPTLDQSDAIVPDEPNDRGSCLFLDKTSCLAITNSAKRNECLTNLAIINDDVTLCPDLAAPRFDGADCATEFAANRALVNSEPLLCKTLADDFLAALPANQVPAFGRYSMTFENSCLTNLAIRKSDRAICDVIENETWRQDCVIEVHIVRGDVEQCLALPLQLMKENCVRDIAVGKTDFGICKSLDGNGRGECYKAIARSLYEEALACYGDDRICISLAPFDEIKALSSLAKPESAVEYCQKAMSDPCLPIKEEDACKARKGCTAQYREVIEGAAPCLELGCTYPIAFHFCAETGKENEAKDFLSRFNSVFNL